MHINCVCVCMRVCEASGLRSRSRGTVSVWEKTTVTWPCLQSPIPAPAPPAAWCPRVLCVFVREGEAARIVERHGRVLVHECSACGAAAC